MRSEDRIGTSAANQYGSSTALSPLFMILVNPSYRRTEPQPLLLSLLLAAAIPDAEFKETFLCLVGCPFIRSGCKTAGGVCVCGSVVRRRNVLRYGCGMLCAGRREDLKRLAGCRTAGESLTASPEIPRGSFLPLCHKQNTRRLSLLPTPTGLGRCQTEQSLSQPLLLSSALSLPLSLPRPVSPTI